MITEFVNLCFNMIQDLLRLLIKIAAKERGHLISESRALGDEDTEKGDFYVKEIVDNLTEERGHKYDPYVIDETLYNFFRIPVLGEAVHLGTYINGLKSLHRADICGINRKVDELSIDAILGAGPLDLTSRVFIKLFGIEKLLIIKLSLNYCKVHANFSIDARTGRNGKFQSLSIDELSGINFSIEGFGFCLCLPSVFVTLWMKLLKRLVRNLVEFKLEQHLGGFLPSYQFPIEGTILCKTLISEHTNYPNAEINGEIEQIQGDANSTEIDIGSFDEHLQTQFPSNHTSKLGKPIWCTNLPLFEDIGDEQGIFNEFNDSDISIQFQFSKNNVIKEDIEPLTRPERPTCCVFFRPEMAECLNETPELFESNITAVSGCEELKKWQRQNSPTKSHSVEDCSPVKYCKDFLGFLTKDEIPAVPGGSELSESERTTVPCNLEATEKEIDRLMQSFFVAYPKFVAFTRHSEETTENSNEKYAIDVDYKMPTDLNKVYDAGSDKRYSGFQEIGSQNKSNPNETTKLMENAADFIEAKYKELCEWKTAYEKKTAGFSNFYKDDFTFDNSSGICETARFNEESKRNIPQNFNHLENEDLINQNEILLDKNTVGNSSNVDKTLKDFNQMEYVESILRWDNENTEEMHTLDTENVNATRKTSSPNRVSSLISDLFNKTQLLKSTLEKMDEPRIADKAVMSLKMAPGLKENNNNKIESSTKYDILTRIERMNTIGEAVLRCFEDPYDSYVIPPANFYFHDTDATNFSELVESGVNIASLKTINQRTQLSEVNDQVTDQIQSKGTATSTVTELKLQCESLKELLVRYPPLNEGNNQTKDSEGGNISDFNSSLLADVSPHDKTIEDDDYYLDWISDCGSGDVSSNSDKGEVDVGKALLCNEEFEYKTNCAESEINITDLATRVENMDRRSSVEIAEILDSEESPLSSSSLKTETLNISKDPSNDSHEEKISQVSIENASSSSLEEMETILKQSNWFKHIR